MPWISSLFSPKTKHYKSLLQNVLLLWIFDASLDGTIIILIIVVNDYLKILLATILKFVKMFWYLMVLTETFIREVLLCGQHRTLYYRGHNNCQKIYIRHIQWTKNVIILSMGMIRFSEGVGMISFTEGVSYYLLMGSVLLKEIAIAKIAITIQ